MIALVSNQPDRRLRVHPRVITRLFAEVHLQEIMYAQSIVQKYEIVVTKARTPPPSCWRGSPLKMASDITARDTDAIAMACRSKQCSLTNGAREKTAMKIKEVNGRGENLP